MTQVKNTISDMLVKKFGQWKYVLVVYPPHQGGHKHYSNYDTKRFRHHGHNFVLHFLPPSNSKACKDPGVVIVRDQHGFYCTNNNIDAHEWYKWIKNHP